MRLHGVFYCSLMEKIRPCILKLKPLLTSPKNQRMISRIFLNRLIIFGFMILVGYCLAKSIQAQSLMGILLALTSLGAGIYFLFLLVKAKEQAEQEETA